MLTPGRTLPLLAALVGALLAVAGPARAASPGLNISSYADAQPALDRGAKQVRFFVRWSDFEPGGPSGFSAQHGPTAPTPLTDGLRVGVDRVLAAGATPIMVVLGVPAWAASGQRPRDPDEYAAFIGELAQWLAREREAGQPSPAYEVWNEPDAPEFWGEEPDARFYTAMLRASHGAIKGGDPGATVLVGPTTGNNFAWVEALYAHGAKGFFDGLSVHTDTACLVAGPSEFYRGADGRLGPYTFLAYREIRAVMVAHDDAKPIWMTELGWETTNGGPTSCRRGASAGLKASGVDEAAQAAFLTKAFTCLANDSYVVAATWFTLRDSDEPSTSTRHGLLRANGSPKPAAAGFGRAAAQGPGACGDFDPPALQVTAPTEGQQFVDRIDVRADAVDDGVGLSRISFAVDGKPNFSNFSAPLPARLTPWYGSSQLALGPHVIEITARDKNGNETKRSIRVVKVVASAATGPITNATSFTLAQLVTVDSFRLPKAVSCRKSTCAIRGSLARSPGSSTIPGRVSVEWEFRNRKGQYRRLSGGVTSSRRPFHFRAALNRAGAWRVRVVYTGARPYKRVASKYIRFRV